MTMLAIMIVLLLAGMIFILFEFLTPTFGVLAAAALLSLGGAVWAGFAVSTPVGVIALISVLIGAPLYILLIVRVLPKLSYTRQSVFMEPAASAVATGTPEASEFEAMVGRDGTAETPLRPSGAVRVSGRRMVAVAESGMIDLGSKIKVVGADGMNLIVRKAD